jgi:hypothetical protein
MKSKKIIQKLGVTALSLAMGAAFIPAAAFADTTTSTEVSTATELQNAIDAGTSSISLTADITGNITIGDGESVTIDMNGHTITGSSDSSSSVVTVEYGGTFDTEDGGSIIANADDTAAVFNSGTATLDDNITLDRSDTAETYYTVVNHGTMTIGTADDADSAVVNTNDQTSSLVENGYYSYSSGNASSGYVKGSNAQYPTLTINDGTFTGGIANVKNDDGGYLTINDGTFSGPAEENVLNWNITKILGGEFTVDTSASTTQGNINNNDGDDNVDQGSLVVSGGTFNADPAIVSTVNGSAGYGTVTVTGGTFAGAVYDTSSTSDTSGVTVDEDSISQASTISDLNDQISDLKSNVSTLEDTIASLKSKYAAPDAVTTIRGKGLKKAAKLTFKKVSGVKRYRIYRSTKKSSGYKYVATVNSSKSTITYKNRKLKSRKTYYYKVKAVKVSGSVTIKSKASKAVKVRTK